MDCSTPGYSVHHQLLEFAQTHNHRVGDVIQLSHPPLLLLPSVFPNIRVFSNESVPHIRWPKYWSFSLSISLNNEYSGTTGQYRRHGFDPWVGKIPWRKKWHPTPGFLPRKFHGQRSLEGYSPWGLKAEHVPLSIRVSTMYMFLFLSGVHEYLRILAMLPLQLWRIFKLLMDCLKCTVPNLSYVHM